MHIYRDKDEHDFQLLESQVGIEKGQEDLRSKDHSSVTPSLPAQDEALLLVWDQQSLPGPQQVQIPTVLSRR